MSAVDVQGKVCVITGASRGLGAGMAKTFLERGARLGLCARTEPTLAGDDVMTASVDVTDAAAVDAFTAQVADRFGPIDLWINNAGVLEPVNPLREVSSDDFRQHLEINVLGVFHGSRAFARHVREAGHQAVLINISSGAARSPYAGWSAYCAGKAAVDRMTECLDIEESDTGLTVYSVAPGIIDTDMQELIRGKTAEEFPLVERFRQLKADDAFTTADVVADAILDLAFNPSAARDRVSIDLRE